MLAQNPQQPPCRSRPAVRPPKKSAAAQPAAAFRKIPAAFARKRWRRSVTAPQEKARPPPGKNSPPRHSSSENKKEGCPRCAPNDCCKNHIFLSGVPKRTPLSPPGFFNPLRCFSLRQACPTQPRWEDTSAPRKPRRPIGGFAACRTAGEKSVAPPQLSPETKKVRFCGLSLNRRKAPGGQTGAFHS